MKTLTALTVSSILALSVLTGGCSGTSTGNPEVAVEFQSYSTTAWFELIPSAYASVSNLKLCFKRLRFKTDKTPDTKTTDKNIDLDVGEVVISPTGTTLTTVGIPAGIYRRVEFDLDAHCASGTSVQVANDNAGSPFSSTESINLKFEGTFTAIAGEQTLRLGIQALVSAMNGVTASGDIKNAAQDADGTF